MGREREEEGKTRRERVLTLRERESATMSCVQGLAKSLRALRCGWAALAQHACKDLSLATSRTEGLPTSSCLSVM